MIEAANFMKNFSATQLFEQQYASAIEALRNQARRTRRDDTQQQPAGGDNTLLGGQ
jgi:hypothetical protein